MGSFLQLETSSYNKKDTLRYRDEIQVDRNMENKKGKNGVTHFESEKTNQKLTYQDDVLMLLFCELF